MLFLSIYYPLTSLMNFVVVPYVYHFMLLFHIWFTVLLFNDVKRGNTLRGNLINLIVVERGMR